MAAVDPVASVRSVRCKDNILLATNLWAPSPSAQTQNPISIFLKKSKKVKLFFLPFD